MQFLQRVPALLIVLVLTASGLVSCGKSDEPANRDTDSTSAPVIDTTQPAKQVQIDSAHVIYYRPQVGDKRRYRVSNTSNATMDVTDQLMGGPSGKQTISTRAEFIVRQEVRSVNPDSSVTVSFFIESINASQLQDTIRNTYSSGNATQKSDPKYDHFTGLIGKEIKAKLSKHGIPDPKSITGIEQIADELVKKMPDSLRSPMAKSMRIQQISGLISQSIGRIAVFLPKQAVGKDSTWGGTMQQNVPVTQTIALPMTQKSTELLRGFEERAGKVVAVLEATTVVTPDKTTIEQGTVTANLKNFKTVVKGVTRVEDATGLVVHRSLNDSRSQDFMLESKQQPGKSYRMVSSAEENYVVEVLP